MRLEVERRLLLNAATPHSIYSVRTASGETRTFKVDERRHLTAPATVELEQRDGSEVPVIRGHAAVFDRESYDLGGFTEEIARGAFKRVLDGGAADCRCLFNHDPNMVLASVRNQTLDLREDPKGLHYYASPVDTSYARDVRELIRRGDVYQSSFAFTVERDRWEEREDGSILRTILEVRDLYDVSPVTYPAYPQTDTTARDAGILSPEQVREALGLETDLVEPTVVEEELEAREGDSASEDATEADRTAREAAHRELVERSKRGLTAARRRSLVTK